MVARVARSGRGEIQRVTEREAVEYTNSRSTVERLSTFCEGRRCGEDPAMRGRVCGVILFKCYLLTSAAPPHFSPIPLPLLAQVPSF